MVTYILPSVQPALKLDRRCPHCHRPHGRCHSAMKQRPISDPKVAAVSQRRMLCPWCGATWTLRSEGVAPGCQRSRRLIGLGVLLYMLGLSYRAVQMVLPTLECTGGKSSIERDVAQAGQQAKLLHRRARRQIKVSVLGVDGTGAAMAGVNRGILFFVSLGPGGGLLGVEPVHEEDTALVREHVRAMMAQVGATELRTDEHSVYAGIVPEGQHRLCLTHWRKSKGKRAYDLLQAALEQGAGFEAATMEELLALLRKQPRAPTVPEELSRLVRRYIYARKGLPWKVNQLLQHVERTWEKVSDDACDPTNNGTERLIGLTLKIRAKTMRGFKSMAKVVSHPYLSYYLRGSSGVCDLREVV